MSSKKPKSKQLEKFESTGSVKRGSRNCPDTYARITESILLSEAFRDLKPHQQMLYIYMREQYMGKRKPSRDYDENSPIHEHIQSELCFYFPWHTAKRYSKRYEGNSGRLYDDIQILINHGFIEKVMSGKNTRKNSIYKYSDEWQRWEKPP